MEYEQRADELDREADDLGHQSEQLQSEIDRSRSDWKRKKSEEGMPGALDEEDAAPGGARVEDPEAEEEE